MNANPPELPGQPEPVEPAEATMPAELTAAPELQSPQEFLGSPAQQEPVQTPLPTMPPPPPPIYRAPPPTAQAPPAWQVPTEPPPQHAQPLEQPPYPEQSPVSQQQYPEQPVPNHQQQPGEQPYPGQQPYEQQYQQPTQYPQPSQAQYPPIPPRWQPPPPPGGKIWLGILIGAGVPILGAILAGWASQVGSYNLAGGLVMFPFWIMLVLAIVLTSLRGTRRTGIGMWIGLATIPIIGLGACVVMIFGSFSNF